MTVRLKVMAKAFMFRGMAHLLMTVRGEDE